MPSEQQIADLVARALDPLELELYDQEYRGGVLRVVVQRPGGVDLDAIAEATRAISRLLDAEDPFPGRYTLEVSSPGLERKLRTPAHYAAAAGERVKVKTRAEIDGQRRFEGELTEADEASFVLRVEDGGTVRLEYSSVDSARTVFEWGPAPRPGKPAEQGSKDRNRNKKAAAQ